VTLERLQVRGDGRLLVTLKGAALAAATHMILAEAPVARVAASATVETVVDVVLPRSAGRTVPRRVVNPIDYSVPADAPQRDVIGSTTVNAPALRPVRRAPIVIGSRCGGRVGMTATGAVPIVPHRIAPRCWRITEPR